MNRLYQMYVNRVNNGLNFTQSIWEIEIEPISRKKIKLNPDIIGNLWKIFGLEKLMFLQSF